MCCELQRARGALKKHNSCVNDLDAKPNQRPRGFQMKPQLDALAMVKNAITASDEQQLLLKQHK